MSSNTTLNELREQEYQQRLLVNQLRREIYEEPTSPEIDTLLDDLHIAEQELERVERARTEREVAQAKDSLIINTADPTILLGPTTTNLEAEVHLRMAQVPTSICHLLSGAESPLLSCHVRNLRSNEPARLRLTSFVDSYSARAVDTIELEPRGEHEFAQLPTFFPHMLRGITELTRATLNVLLEDLDGTVEIHTTKPIWLLARNAAPLAIQDPKTGKWTHMTPYFAAFVTPNAPDVIRLLRLAAQRHPEKRLRGPSGTIESQVRAIFETLKEDTGIVYVNSLLSFIPEQGLSAQRVRLPSESLAERQANCIDGTVLFASLLEAASLHPAIVTIPQHTFIAWETEHPSEWRYLDTTLIGNQTFEEASRWGETLARRYQAEAERTQNSDYFQQYALRELRAIKRITPME